MVISKTVIDISIEIVTSVSYLILFPYTRDLKMSQSHLLAKY
jgi:hypothetical protein